MLLLQLSVVVCVAAVVVCVAVVVAAAVIAVAVVVDNSNCAILSLLQLLLFAVVRC